MAMKLRPAGATAFWSTIAIILILAAVRFFFDETGFRVAIGTLMGAMCLMHLVILLRIRNGIYLIPFAFYLFGALTFLSARVSILVPLLAAAAGIAYLLMLWALFTRRMRWRYREVLELAAKPVDGAGDGFTTRPYPAGEGRYTREELIPFSRYLLKHMIAFPRVEPDRIVLIIPENMLPWLLGLRRRYRNSTFISFGFDGKISVRIAECDYKRYREELTFDELCRSFGALFEDFLELHRGGSGTLITRRLDRPEA